MPSFRNGHVDIDYIDHGEGRPVALVHGFASNKEVNWLHTGWIATLNRAGRRVVVLDNRGHGASTKLYDPADYHVSRMVDDLRALLDHLGIEAADVMGYSMGARIAAFFALGHPTRVRGVVLGGLGVRLVDGAGLSQDIALALEAPSVAAIGDAMGRTFRAFAEQTRSDLRALAACMRGSRQVMAREQAARIRAPTLIAVGGRDAVAGSARELAQIIPGARVLDIADRDHMLAVGDRVFKEGVVNFLNEIS
ncbi:MAG: alpha/beta fold hydrolase [Proteobacteria bacterium]|nr:alpha/beta fold hydrolase [Pseudomonadota bacterium]